MPELLHPGVYVREVSSGVRPIEGVSTSTAAFIGATEKGPIPGTILPNRRMAEPDMVTSLTEYFRRYGGFRKDSFMTYAVRAFYENGGRRVYIVRVAPTPPKNPQDKNKAPVAATGKVSPDLAVSAANEGEWGNGISIRIANSSDFDPNSANKDHFKLQVLYRGNVVESFDNLTILPANPTDPIPTNYVQTLVNSRSEYIAITAPVKSRPINNIKFDEKNPFGEPTDDKPQSLVQGSDGSGNIDYIGQAAPGSDVTGTGLHALDKVTDVNLIAIPGQGDPGTVSKGMEYCKNFRALQDCFFIGDVGKIDVESARAIGAQPDVGQIAAAVKFAGDQALNKAAGDYGAIYYPWILSTDPFGIGANPRILLPPSGFLAGIYARVDNSRGVFKAPAGTTDSGVAGALAVATTVSDAEQDRLNPIGVNVVRTVPTAGIVVWGTRTIGSDAEWRYIPVRRMAIFLRVSIYYGIQWAVFEPNDFPLWASLTLNIESFMLTQFRAGAFQGRTPDDAFFVRCDETTTTQQDIDNGVVNILVGFAPLKPAEFVVLKLSQKVNQPAA